MSAPESLLDSNLTFSQAAQQWVESRRFPAKRGRYVAEQTIHSYDAYIKPLMRFFGERRLSDIGLSDFAAYQQQRASGLLGPAELPDGKRINRWGSNHAVGPNKINQELQACIRILRRAGLWTAELEDAYERLQREEADIPRAMTPDEQQELLRVAASNPEWRVVYWYAVLALRTTANNAELRGLRLADVNLFQGIITIQPAMAKNIYRIRTIPLAPDALSAVEALLDRARSCGAIEPRHYLFPFRKTPKIWDPLKPMTNSGIKRDWDAVRKAAGLPWLRIHDLRHSAITRLAEAGTPIPVIMSMAGHISPRMMQHYTQISAQVQRYAVAAAYNGQRYGEKPRATKQPQRRPVLIFPAPQPEPEKESNFASKNGVFHTIWRVSE